jgi:hypothetical protein
MALPRQRDRRRHAPDAATGNRNVQLVCHFRLPFFWHECRQS